MTRPSLGTVLIIDDERIDQAQYRRVLGRSGMADEILVFSLADDALQWLQESPARPADLILLDMNMPRMNGLEFLNLAADRLRAAGTIVILMLTTDLTPADQARADSLDLIRARFDKPLTLAQLESARTMLQDVRR